MSAYLLIFCRGVLAFTLMLSSISKIRDVSGFSETIQRYSSLPQRPSAVAAYLILMLEAAIVPLLVVRPMVTVGFALALSLLFGFSILLLVALSRGQTASCHCFGKTETPIGAAEFVRNAGLILTALCGLLLDSGQPAVAWHEGLLILLAAATVVVLWSNLGEVTHLLKIVQQPVARGEAA